MRKLLILFFLFPFILYATEAGHAEKEYLTGSGFDLVKTGDLIEGTFQGMPIIGDKKCGEYFRGVFKDQDGDKEFSIAMLNGKLTGNFNGKQIVYSGYDKEKQNILLKVGTTVVPVNFSAEGFANGHYYGVTITFTNAFKVYRVYLNGNTCMSSLMFYCIFLLGTVSL